VARASIFDGRSSATEKYSAVVAQVKGITRQQSEL
jgi:hypothetical protein